jgi:NADH-quinone oxidoreductase subunit B
VALTPDGPGEAVAPDPVAAGAPPAADPRPEAASELVTAPPRDPSLPIVVPNTLWTSIRADAYRSEAQAVTHLRDLEGSDLALSDTRRWGQLEVIPTKADLLVDLIRMNSLWPLLSGLACCAFEMMSAATSKNDMDRWGMFPFRASPRQADVLIVAGTLTTKMAGPLVRLWEQMPEPKWCIAMGDCTCSGGRYKRSYSTIEGIDRVMPVDVYVPGCPPRPEGLIYGMMKLGQLVKEQRGHFPERRIGPTVPADV